jgi:hypothetical protein
VFASSNCVALDPQEESVAAVTKTFSKLFMLRFPFGNAQQSSYHHAVARNAPQRLETETSGYQETEEVLSASAVACQHQCKAALP